MQLESKVLCEEFRQEVNGKYMLLGVYRSVVVVNNFPKERRWLEPMRWCFFAGVNLDRKKDAGRYVIRSISESGNSCMPDIPLEIKADGDDFVQLPIRVIMNMKEAGEIVINIYKEGSEEVYFELGRIFVRDAG